MTNLLISRRCNQKCSYCFAGNDPDEKKRGEFISIADFDQRLDYLDRSGIEQARFLGGEPTLHPQFPELVRRALARNKKIIVFTNGWMQPASLAALEDLSPEQSSIILNISATGSNESGGPARLKRQHEVLKRLGPKVQPGCNLYKMNQSIHWMIRLINESGCKRSIRMGLAQPVLQGQNVFLPTNNYRQAGEQIVRFASDAAVDGIKIELDCGFVRCMFSTEEIQRLADLNADFAWRCSPILDIDIDGKVFHCFPLASKYQSQIDSNVTAADLREEFFHKTEPYRQGGIFKECSSCSYKQEQTCSGGCLSNIIHRFSTQPFHFSM